MNKHTVSLKLSKQMGKLGWEKETLFVWVKFKDYSPPLLYDPKDIASREKLGFVVENIYPAPIASEILEELSDFVTVGKEPRTKGGKYYSDYIHKKDNPITAPTPAEALGKMWVYLKEEGLI